MKLLKIYQLSLIISCVLYLIYWFSPWLYGYLDTESQQILALGGIKSTIELPGWFWNLFLILSLVSYVGMFLLRKAFRTLFVILIVASYPLGSLSGMVVMTGFEFMLVDILTLLDGVVISLAYLSKLNDQFY